MKPIKASAGNFWYTLSNAETLTIYQLAIARTWQLLKQAVQLFVVLFLAVITFAIWVWVVSFSTGRSFREWLEKEQPTLPELLAAGWNLLVTSLKSTQNWVQTQLKTQWGLELQLPPMPEFKALEPSSTSEATKTTIPAEVSKKR
jgi:hypothetical protein